MYQNSIASPTATPPTEPPTTAPSNLVLLGSTFSVGVGVPESVHACMIEVVVGIMVVKGTFVTTAVAYVNVIPEWRGQRVGLEADS